jgi:DNA-binding NarL/FixJ family response regulator
MDPVRLLIADDHPLFRSGVRSLLAWNDDLEIVGEATSGEEAITLAEQLQPDVILMDIKMPGLDGIEAARVILNRSPHIRLLIVTMFEDDASVFAALRAGARGYVLKGAAPDEMLRAIRSVAGGEAIFSPAIAQRLIDYFAQVASTRPPSLLPELTEREHEILQLIVQGHTNPAIARKLAISLKTVQNHVSNVFSKLQVVDRAEAIARARDAGLR